MRKGYVVAQEASDQLIRSSPLALHEQLTALLREQIERTGPGSKLPTEDELLEAYGVSRTTVRKAVETLVNEGVLIRRQGKGTFVALQPIVQSLDRLAPFVEALPNEESTHTRLIEHGWVSGEAVPEPLGGPNATAMMFRRLYLTDEIPHALVRSTVREDLGRRINRDDLEQHPIYDLLQNQLGVMLHEAELNVSCRPANRDVTESLDPDVPDLLEILPGSSLLILERVTVDRQRVPVECATHYLRPDVYRLRVHAQADGLPGFMRLPTPQHDGAQDRA